MLAKKVQAEGSDCHRSSRLSKYLATHLPKCYVQVEVIRAQAGDSKWHGTEGLEGFLGMEVWT